MWCVLVSTGCRYRGFPTTFSYNYPWRRGSRSREGGMLDYSTNDDIRDMEGYEEG